MSTSLRNVIISGFHDSIGLYTKSTDTEKAIADEWLALLGMSDRADEPFNRLSFGDQRLVLIARHGEAPAAPDPRRTVPRPR